MPSPSPSSSQASPRPDLSQSFMEFNMALNEQGFIGAQVLPVIDVMQPFGTFHRIPVEQLLQVNDTKRSPGGGYSSGSWKFESDTFTTQEHGWEEPIDDALKQWYAESLDVDQIAAMRAYGMILGNYERRVAAAVFNTAVWTGSSLATAAATPWTTHASAAPIDDVFNAVTKVRAGSGLWANAVIMSRTVFRHCRECTQVLNRINGTGISPIKAADVTAQQLAQCFDVDRVIVAGSTKNTANESAAAATFASDWDDTLCMVARLNTGNDITQPGLGRTFHYTADGSQLSGISETYRKEEIRADVVRVRHQTGEKILLPQAGHLITTVTA